jgi:hypothetical protein
MRLSPQDDLNRAIFKAMKTLTNKGEPCTHRAIAELAHLEDLADSLRP